jgi:hypothetical protein
MSVENSQARTFYEPEAIRGGLSVRQLDRQISTQFFERTVRSKNQATMLARGQEARPEEDQRIGEAWPDDLEPDRKPVCAGVSIASSASHPRMHGRSIGASFRSAA